MLKVCILSFIWVVLVWLTGCGMGNTSMTVSWRKHWGSSGCAVCRTACFCTQSVAGFLGDTWRAARVWSFWDPEVIGCGTGSSSRRDELARESKGKKVKYLSSMTYELLLVGVTQIYSALNNLINISGYGDIHQSLGGRGGVWGQANPVYIESFRTASTTQWNPISRRKGGGKER